MVEALRQDREHPQPQPQMRGPAGHQRERQRMLSEHHALNHIERKTRHEGQRQAARRGATRWTSRSTTSTRKSGRNASSGVRQRQHRQRQRHQRRERHGQSANAGRRASFVVCSAGRWRRLCRRGWGGRDRGTSRCRQRRRFGRGGSRGRLRLQPHEHEFARTIERRRRFHIDIGQRLRRIALDLGDRADRIAGRKSASQARSHQQIARRPHRRWWAGTAA